MRAEDFKLGMRVRRRSGEGSFVRDGISKARRVGIVVGLPEPVNARHRGVRIQPEGSSIIETVLIHRLEPLPLKDQPVALGGQWTPEDHTFLTSKPPLPSRQARTRR